MGFLKGHMDTCEQVALVCGSVHVAIHVYIRDSTYMDICTYVSMHIYSCMCMHVCDVYTR